ncbi:MAG TPA: DUF2249 domain-containing protein [Actinocrinis sp.]|jgi:uncharacterized protein (DUF2249 family)
MNTSPTSGRGAPAGTDPADDLGGLDVLDVREVPKPQRHGLIIQRFAALSPGASFVLVNGHDPKHLRAEFDRDHLGAYEWSYLESGPVWRIRIGRVTDADLPRPLCDTAAVLDGAADAAGAVWKLEVADRHLDANVIRLRPGARIDPHRGPDLDVLVHVLSGDGRIEIETGEVPLSAGQLVWLPRRSRRSIVAGAAGLGYLSVHPRRPGLAIQSAAPR